jgi:hypothetical protein
MVHYFGQAVVIAILDGQALCGHVAVIILIAIVLARLILALGAVLNYRLSIVAVIGPPC